MSVKMELMDVITTVLILMEAIIVLVWMDTNWNQIITLVQVKIIIIVHVLRYQFKKASHLDPGHLKYSGHIGNM